MLSLSHENAIRFMGVTLQWNTWFIVMEHFVSDNLRKVLYDESCKADHALQPIDRAWLCVQLAKVVTFMHALEPEILHLDLKPENVLVNASRDLKVCDFGIAKSPDLTYELISTEGRRPKGTMFYIAPEVLEQTERATAKSDESSMGCTQYKILVERHPWDLPPNGTMTDGLKSHIRDVRVPTLSTISEGLHSIFRQMFSFDRESRCHASTALKTFNKYHLGLGRENGLIKGSESEHFYHLH